MSQTQFAGLGEASKRAQINYEQGDSTPDASYLAAVSRVGVDVLYVITGVHSAALVGDEALLIEGFRRLDADSKRRTLAMVYGGTPPAPKFNVQGGVDNQFENNYGNINIDKRGK